MTQRAANRFHAFNAKYLPAEEVAKTFIPPRPQWDTLTQNGHTLLIGPRGAGKTTLLKMLTSRGLVAWDEGEEARQKIAFTGVFVTTDRTWSEQLGALGGSLSAQHRTAIALATFTAHVLHALVSTAHDRAHNPTSLNHAPLDEVTEAQIAEECANAWGLTGPPIVSFRALQSALMDRVTDISDLADNEELRGPEGRGERIADQLPTQNFWQAALSFIDRFNTAIGEPEGLWCMLFDELELAPPSVITRLTSILRGGDRRVIFKLSLAPYTQGARLLEEALGAQQAHDFQIESLSYPKKVDALDFCRRLLASRLGVPLEALDEEAVLGRSAFASTGEENDAAQTSYRIDTRRMEPVMELADKDETFRSWLRSAGVNLQQLGDVDAEHRARSLRKIITLAQVRNFARSDDATYVQTGRRRRPRKTLALYGGALSLYAMAEGNPRWFYNLIEPLLRSPNPRRPALQSDRIRRVNRLFRIVLTALPLAPSERNEAERGVLPVLDAIGVAFSNRVVDDDFTADPPLTFVVDEQVEDPVLKDLQFALNVGGIVHMPKDEDRELLVDLRGQTFRLAYMLAPTFPLPLTTGRAVELSTLLASQAPSWKLSDEVSDQLAIPFEDDTESADKDV